MTRIASVLPSAGDCLIVVPPFGSIDRPNLGVHILQSCAKERGYRVAVLYANLSLAGLIGDHKYEAVCYSPTTGLVGERLFSALAYGLPQLGKQANTSELGFKRTANTYNHRLSFAELKIIEDQLSDWLDELVEDILQLQYPIIGCTTTFEQTSASIALLQAVKRRDPQCITVLGGANCEGAMAEGIHTLSSAIDYIFSGESETSFVSFLEAIAQQQRPTEHIIIGRTNRALDKLPTPDFADYYRQFETLGAIYRERSHSIWLPFESSRGCWWGEKKHCTFCGINGEGMPFRQKSASRVIGELQILLQRHPNNKICMVDNIMPFEYFTTLLPRVAPELGELYVFYEQKANLSFEKIKLLKEAGVAIIQPGIEALSTPLLKLMRKGVTAEQNIRLLRYSRAVDLSVNWNLLYAFPGDVIEWYEETIALVPYLSHLNPPTGVFQLSVDRFSPYFDTPEDFAVSNIQPIPEYFDVLPASAAVAKIAYHFEADYRSDSKTLLHRIRPLKNAIDAWRSLWLQPEAAAPLLEISRIDDDTYILLDTRPIRSQDVQFIDREQARVALSGCPSTSSLLFWATENHLVYEIEGKWIPLATATYELFCELTGSPLTVPSA
jgi:ribosomal peptide maturation radical SAM protein 1